MKCARTECDSQNAVCPHTQTGRLYCPACRLAINDQPGQAGLVAEALTPTQAEAFQAAGSHMSIPYGDRNGRTRYFFVMPHAAGKLPGTYTPPPPSNEPEGSAADFDEGFGTSADRARLAV